MLPGTQTMRATIPPNRRVTMMLNAGSQSALGELKASLEAMQKQHPAAVGITLTLALLERDRAVLRAEAARIVLTVAAKAGMPIEDHAIVSRFDGEEMVIEAVPGDDRG